MKVQMALDNLKTIFNACKTFVSKDDIRPILQTVQLNFGGGLCTAYALDGIKLISVVVPYDGGDEGTLNVPIIKLPKGTYVTISDEGNEIVFDFLESKQAVRKVEGEYPKNPEQFFNKQDASFSIGFDPKNLKDALDGFKDHKTIRFDFYKETEAALITGTNKKALVFPVRLK